MEIYDLIKNYKSDYQEENYFIKKTLKFLENHQNVFSRELKVGHFTASSFLVNSDKTKFLLMHHKN